MGLFGGSSKSKSTQNVTDNSITADLSSGDLGGSKNNIIAGGNVTYAGLSEDLANSLFGSIKDMYSTTYDFVSDAISSERRQTDNTVSAVSSAYNTGKSTWDSLQPFAIYALIAVVIVSYFRGGK